ncbi:hypothetical protein JCM8097_003732 [Rhodosporidiobolus ruineniae]
MSLKTTQECWVCGKATAERCSACAKEGIDIFFCSAEHQKLVWPVHKLFCGPGRAKPFILPLFTEDEANDMLGRLDEPFDDVDGITGGGGTTTLKQALLTQQPFDSRFITMWFRLYSAIGTGSRNYARNRGPQFHLALARLADFHRLSRPKPSPSHGPLSPAQYALAQVSRMVVLDLHSIYCGPNEPLPRFSWLTHLLHRAAFYFFLAAQRAENAQSTHQVLEDYAKGQLAEVIKNEVGPAHPAVADSVWSGLARRHTRN